MNLISLGLKEDINSGRNCLRIRGNKTLKCYNTYYKQKPSIKLRSYPSLQMHSIESLKATTSTAELSSPQRCTKPLRCAILTKGELRTNSKNDKSFTMTLCDRSPTSMIKGICFDESFYDTLQPTKTYIFSKYKLRSGYGNLLQLHIDGATVAELSSVQYTIEKKKFKISQIIRKETQHVQMFNVECKILHIEEKKLVGKHPNQLVKRDIHCGDSTGSIILVLWRTKAEHFEHNVNDTILIENITTSTFRNMTNLASTSEMVITKINDPTLAKVHLPQIAQQQETPITTVTTNIASIKEFKSYSQCINCNTKIELMPPKEQEQSSDELIECPTCMSWYLMDSSKVINECSFKLATDNYWYSAKTAVSTTNSLY